MEKEKSSEITIDEEEVRELLRDYQKEIKAFGLDLVWSAIFKKHYHKKCRSINLQEIGEGFSILSPDGDEEVCSLIFCEKCQSYRFYCYHDHFMGDDDFIYEKEFTSEEAEMVKEAVLKCKIPHDKHCRCEYHEKIGDILYRGFMEFIKQEMPKSGFQWSDEEKTWVKI